MLRVAVVMSGGIRTLEHCFSSLEVALEENNTAFDLFATFVSDDIERARNAIRLTNPLDVRVIAPWGFSKYFDGHVDGSGNRFGFSVAYPMAFANHLAWELCEKSGNSYDVVIRTRPDNFFGALTLRKTPDNVVNVPGIACFGNTCDQFAYGSMKAMAGYFGWWDWLKELDPVGLKEKYATLPVYGISSRNGLFHLAPEFLLREYLASISMNVAKRDVDFRILRQAHVGIPYNKIPINNQRFASGEV